ncbi:MAG: leucyl/phenylalanyl-tRNA--protein transferase, partial [Rhodospirillaceae bacterium]|nr:leucyl/phenylalanyl-tRNA--protein transferase [Rhodospirillaceae bacterium]
MTSSDGMSPEQIKLTPEIILRAYAAGIFPM